MTAFRPGMRVHGRYETNETSYCAAGQTGSRILKDRSLSRLLHEDWPKTLDGL